MELEAIVSRPLRSASRRQCVVSALAYFFLFLRGVMHLIVALYRGGFHPPAESLTIDMILLSVVMFIELSLAVTTKTTTLHRWAYVHIW